MANSQPELNLGLSPRLISVSSLIVAVGCATTLVIVATIKSADALSTIGMALAIIAFVAQLIQLAGQTIVSNHQYEQTVAVNTQTQTLLAEIRVSTGALIDRRDQQFELLLQSVVPAAVAEGLAEQPSDGQSVDVDELARRVVETTLAQLPNRGQQDSMKTASRLDDLAAAHPDIARTLRTEPASTQLRVWRRLSEMPNGSISALTNEQLVDIIRSSSTSR